MKSSNLVVFLGVVLAVLLALVSSAVASDEARDLSAAAAAEADAAALPINNDWLAYVRQHNRFNKRGGGNFPPSDPRNLFAAIYGNYASNIG